MVNRRLLPRQVCTMLWPQSFGVFFFTTTEVYSSPQEEVDMKLLTAARALLRLEIFLGFLIVLGLVIIVVTQDVVAQDHAMGTGKPATIMTGLGDLHHPVSTTNAEAQQFFDQGLRLIYAFNHDEAARSFRRATELDAKLAIAYWGIAEAVGPNYNDPASEEGFKQAHEAIQKAVDLSANASPSEQAYIQAMARRFPADPNTDLKKAAEEYHEAMREVVTRFPDDLDAATLF